jgi:hypothetical protein
MLFSGYVEIFGKRVLHFDIYVKRRVRSERRWKKAIVWGVQRISLFAFSEVFSYFPVLGWIADRQNAAGDFEIRSRWPSRAKGREGSP